MIALGFMTKEQKHAGLRHMMAAYGSPKHQVVGFHLKDGERSFLSDVHHTSESAPEYLIFEIGSISKVFTALLLCVLVEEGKIDPHAPISQMSDQLRDVPDWITPENLASHTSGLPRLHVPVWKALLKPLPEDPYASFTRADLLTWFKTWNGKAPGAKPRHVYSNLGIGLLGEAMSIQEGRPFLQLLTEKVIAPLGLKDTVQHLREDRTSRFMQPRNSKGEAVPIWTFQAIAPAGCLKSTPADLARFAEGVIGAVNAPSTTLDKAIGRSVAPVLGLGPKRRMEPVAQCSGWLSVRFDQAQPAFLNHEGATAGSTCAIYICPAKNEAFGILSNNGVAASLWSGLMFSRTGQPKQAQELFALG